MANELEFGSAVNYPKMYAILCGGISDALDRLPLVPATEEPRRILEQALEDAEEFYLQG